MAKKRHLAECVGAFVALTGEREDLYRRIRELDAAVVALAPFVDRAHVRLTKGVGYAKDSRTVENTATVLGRGDEVREEEATAMTVGVSNRTRASGDAWYSQPSYPPSMICAQCGVVRPCHAHDQPQSDSAVDPVDGVVTE